jgi:hypothetical protein
MLVRKNQLQGDKPAGSTTMEKSRLTQERTLALRRQDYAEVEDIDAKLADLVAATAPSSDRNRKDGITDVLAKVNERNRKANHEVVRKAEIMEVERKRRERKLASAGGTITPHDPSARLKTLPRLFNAATPSSRFVILSPALFSFTCVSLAHFFFFLHNVYCVQARNSEPRWHTSTTASTYCYAFCVSTPAFGTVRADHWQIHI